MVFVNVSQRKLESIKRDYLKREYWKTTDNDMWAISIRRWCTKSPFQRLRYSSPAERDKGNDCSRNEIAMQNECAKLLFFSMLMLPLQSRTYTPRGFIQHWPNDISKRVTLGTRMVFSILMPRPRRLRDEKRAMGTRMGLTFPGFPRDSECALVLWLWSKHFEYILQENLLKIAFVPLLKNIYPISS